MTDMAELAKRKKALNLAVVYVEPDAFVEDYLGLAGNHRLHQRLARWRRSGAG